MVACWEVDPPAFMRHTEPVARVRHRCCECSRWIAPGDRYHRFDGKWEGEVMTFKRCRRCHRIGQHIVKYGECDLLGDLVSQILDGGPHGRLLATLRRRRRGEEG